MNDYYFPWHKRGNNYQQQQNKQQQKILVCQPSDNGFGPEF